MKALLLFGLGLQVRELLAGTILVPLKEINDDL
jgi:hypothetical protein